MSPKRKSARDATKKVLDEEKIMVDEKWAQEGSSDSDMTPNNLKVDRAVSKTISDITTSKMTDPSASVDYTSEGQKDHVVSQGAGAIPSSVNQLEKQVMSPYPYPYPGHGVQYPQGGAQYHPPQYPPPHYGAHQYHPHSASSYDPDQEYYMQYYSQQNALATPTPGMSYEIRRSQNQMSHYFDTSKYPMNQPVPMMQGQAAPMKVTKKDIERFKKRKEEKKRMKNKWLFE